MDVTGYLDAAHDLQHLFEHFQAKPAAVEIAG